MQSKARKSSNIRIRASEIGGFNDCARKAAAKTFKFQIEKEGFTLNQPIWGGGPATSIGKAVHKAAEEMLHAKLDGVPFFSDPAELAVKEFEELHPHEVEPDKSTKDKPTAITQVRKLTGAIARHLQTINPKQMEFELLAPYAPGIELSGHPDVLTQEDWLRDFKTGGTNVPPPYQAQLGTYAVLGEYNGIDIKGVAVDFVQKVAVDTPQPEVQVVTYDVVEAKKHAMSTIENTVEAYEKFLRTKDPGAFNANPNTNLCSPKYCTAWGTDFCTVGKPLRQTKEE